MPVKADNDAFAVLLRYTEFSGQKLSAEHAAAAAGIASSTAYGRIAHAKNNNKIGSNDKFKPITGSDVFKMLVEYTDASRTKLNATAAAKAAGIAGSTAYGKIAAARKEIEGTETAGSPAKPKATPTKKAPAAKRSPRKKRSAGEAIDGEDGGTTGDSTAADNSPSKKARKGTKNFEEEIKEEIMEEVKEEIKQEIKEEEVVDDESGLGHTITVKAVKNDKTETVEEEAVETETGLTITIEAEKQADEGPNAANDDGQIARNNAVNEMSAESEQVRDEDLAAPEISAEDLGHLAAHRSSRSSTGLFLLPSAVVTTTSLTEGHSQSDLEAVHASAPFGYGKVAMETQDGTTCRGRSATVNSVCDPRKADWATDQFVEQLDAESHDSVKREDRQDEKVFVA